LAASEDHIDIVEYLINQGIDINPADRWGNTPLDDAQSAMAIDVIELLIKSGADNEHKKASGYKKKEALGK
jgi:ankyrin repeat protein